MPSIADVVTSTEANAAPASLAPACASFIAVASTFAFGAYSETTTTWFAASWRATSAGRSRCLAGATDFAGTGFAAAGFAGFSFSGPGRDGFETWRGAGATGVVVASAV